jgi:dTDP-4-dehydrorhamnose reductase
MTKPIKSFDYPTLAKRPENSRLDCTKIYKNFEITEDDWKVRLIEYLNILR